MLVVSTPPLWFRCPGELYDIPVGVHRARLAAGYDKCTDCPQRRQTPTGEVVGSPPGPPPTGPASRAARLWRAEGVRGIFLNEFDCQMAEQIAAAFARSLHSWAEADSPPMVADTPTDAEEAVLQQLLAGRAGGPRRALRVLLGHDERRFSPELAAAAAGGLRQMGCDVRDVGLVSQPELAQYVRTHSATGALLVTGAGAPADHGGCDLWGPHGRPCSSPGALDAVRSEWLHPTPQPPRALGNLVSRRGDEPDSAVWQALVHGLRPLRVAWGCGLERITAELARRLIRTDCRLHPVASGLGGGERGMAAVRETLRRDQCHLGVAVSSDRQQVVFLDERGELLRGSDLRRAVNGGQSSAGPASPTREQAWRQRTEEPTALLTEGPENHFWTSGPQCDALQTVLVVMRWLSESDQPLSERVRSLDRRAS